MGLGDKLPVFQVFFLGSIEDVYAFAYSTHSERRIFIQESKRSRPPPGLMNDGGRCSWIAA